MFIVAKDTSNPTVLKLTIQGLASSWAFNVDYLTSNKFDPGLPKLSSSSSLKTIKGSAKLEASK